MSTAETISEAMPVAIVAEEETQYKEMRAEIAQMALKNDTKPQELISKHEDLIKLAEKIYGETSVQMVEELKALSMYCEEKSSLRKAEATLMKALEIEESLYGEESREVTVCLNHIARFQRIHSESQTIVGNMETVISNYRRSLEILEKLHGPNSIEVARTLHNLGAVLHDELEYGEAKILLERAIRIKESTVGKSHASYASSLNALAEVHRMQGDVKLSKRLHKTALKIRRRVHGKKHPEVATSLNNKALLLWGQDENSVKAQLVGRKAYKIALKTLGPSSQVTADLKEDWILED